MSIKSGVFPNEWKKTLIHPIHKKGDKSDIANYRGIAILNAMEKVFEKIVHQQLLYFLLPKLDIRQHGFLPGKSTLSNLLEHVTDLMKNNEDKKIYQTDVGYFDASKAFDTVVHSRLIERLKQLGIDGSLLKWFEDYLRNRSVIVAFNGALSTQFIPQSGVPQGSILGPILFIVYVNFLSTETQLKSKALFYADDIKISHSIQHDTDMDEFQDDVNNINDWCSNNGLTLNLSKCEVVSYAGYRAPMTNSYTINEYTLVRSKQYKDLGVVFDSSHRFIYHIDSIVSRGFKALGFVMRMSKELRNQATIIHLYNTLVRSKVEYATVIWSPYYNQYIEKIEALQHRFTRYLFRKFHIPYMDYKSRLKVLNMPSLVIRRKRTDLYLLYKIMNGHLRTGSIADICVRKRRNVRNMNIFNIGRSTNNVTLYSPIYRMCRTYNEVFKDQYLFNLPYRSYVTFVDNSVKDIN